MRRYKLDGIEVSADTFVDFLEAGVKQLQAENKELKAILSFKNDVADSMNQYKMKYEDALFEIDELKELLEAQQKLTQDLIDRFIKEVI